MNLREPLLSKNPELPQLNLLTLLSKRDISNKISSYLVDKTNLPEPEEGYKLSRAEEKLNDYATLRTVSRVLHGPIQVPNYHIQYAIAAYEVTSSFFCVGDCCDPDGHCAAPMIRGEYGPFDFERHPRKIPGLSEKITVPIQVTCNCLSMCSCETLRLGCCTAKYAVGLLACSLGFLAGTVKKLCLNDIRKTSQKSLILPPSEAREIQSEKGPGLQEMF